MPLNLKRVACFSFVLALLCFLAPGCERPGDQTEEANRLVEEMNALNAKGEIIAKQAASKEEEIGEKDVQKEGDAVHSLAQEQVGLYKQAAESYREAAARAEQASRLRINDWFKNYLTLKAQTFRKLAEAMDAGREGAELWVNERDLDVISEKRDQLGERAETLSKEAQDLSGQARKIEDEHKADFTR